MVCGSEGWPVRCGGASGRRHAVFRIAADARSWRVGITRSDCQCRVHRGWAPGRPQTRNKTVLRRLRAADRGRARYWLVVVGGYNGGCRRLQNCGGFHGGRPRGPHQGSPTLQRKRSKRLKGISGPGSVLAVPSSPRDRPRNLCLSAAAATQKESSGRSDWSRLTAAKPRPRAPATSSRSRSPRSGPRPGAWPNGSPAP